MSPAGPGSWGTAGRVAAFATGLAVVFVAALGIGHLVGDDVGPAAEADPAGHSMTEGSAPAMAGDAGSGHGLEHEGGAEELPGGLLTSQDGYTLRVLGDSSAPAGVQVPVRFRILGPDGHAVTAYDVGHERRLHLIAVRRDATGFQHVHPVLGADGTWRTRVDLTPGSWRIFADFTPSGGPALVLGSDLQVTGRFVPARSVDTERHATVAEGYTVALDGSLRAGQASELAFTVRRHGRPVSDLQPYLGADGHLVALRQGDLAYLHVHPHPSPGPGPTVRFTAEVPTAGTYYLFLDFKDHGVVRTAGFTQAATSMTAEEDHGDDH